ncbi:myb-like protein I isoform X2 [Armigeres subalbatus]|uniref:myb-like protein I isoform X2 n=1 Tax=Armigeres subalbatus TaxID=124917 RepID=UPI002ED5DD1B
MSTSRYLNWSRPSPGRHHPLRKQVSCFESFSYGGGRSLSAHSRGPVIISAVSGGTDGSGTSTTLGSDGPPRATPRRRPASAHTSSSLSTSRSRASVLSGPSTMARKVSAHEGRKVLTKQLSLDHPNVASGPPAGHAWATPASRTASVCGSGPVAVEDQYHGPAKTCASSGIKKRPTGLSVKNDAEPIESIKKALKQGKDSRINIKIFLGQSVQQDSSDTGHSDTESSPNQSQQHHRSQNQQTHQQQQQQQQQSNQKAEAENSQPELESKPKQPQPSSSTISSGGGRSSSLAQRRAQFHASRQHSEAAERRPPLVRAMSAPIRPIDTDSKFLQSKKKSRKKKILRERDEINECDEDDFDEETLKLNAANSKNTLAVAGQRSRSVLGGACDIETLVSLLSSGGSDSEKEDTVPTESVDLNNSSTINYNSVLKLRAPMLKKAGKSVSFQETELKQSAGLNRDYYQPGHRKPPSLQPFANRIRRSQQLANTLNAFQKKKNLTENNKSDDEKDAHSDDESKEVTVPTNRSNQASHVTKTNSTASGAPGDGNGGDGDSGNQDLVDGQTPKERECYRLFKKMSNMGLSVSYDTILRGMLTPTELRVLQKQKSKLQKQQESRQNSSETETNDSSDNSKSDGPPGMGGFVGDNRAELGVVADGPPPVLVLEQTVAVE